MTNIPAPLLRRPTTNDSLNADAEIAFNRSGRTDRDDRRDAFAIAAMRELIAAIHDKMKTEGTTAEISDLAPWFARSAFDIADAMLAESDERAKEVT